MVWIIRIVSLEKMAIFFVDRKIEYQNLKTIEPLELCNETVYFDVETGEKSSKIC